MFDNGKLREAIHQERVYRNDDVKYLQTQINNLAYKLYALEKYFDLEYNQVPEHKEYVKVKNRVKL